MRPRYSHGGGGGGGVGNNAGSSRHPWLEIEPILSSAHMNQRHFGENSRCHSTTGFRENVLVAESSYQVLEVLSFCERKRAWPPLVKITLLAFWWTISKIKLSGVSLSWEKYAKKVEVKSHTRSRSRPRIQRSLWRSCTGKWVNFRFAKQSHSTFRYNIDPIKMANTVVGFKIYQRRLYDSKTRTTGRTRFPNTK